MPDHFPTFLFGRWAQQTNTAVVSMDLLEKVTMPISSIRVMILNRLLKETARPPTALRMF